MATTAFRSKAVVLLCWFNVTPIVYGLWLCVLFSCVFVISPCGILGQVIDSWFCLLPYFCVWSLFCYTVLSELSNFAIPKEERAALLYFNCLLGVVWLSVFCGSSLRCHGLVGLQCVIVAVPVIHTWIQRGGGGTGSPDTPLKNHKNVGFLSNTGRDPLKTTKLPTQWTIRRHLNVTIMFPGKTCLRRDRHPKSDTFWKTSRTFKFHFQNVQKTK